SADGVSAVFARLNALPPVDGYVTRHLCPRDDSDVDLEVDRLFFTRRNGRQIDAMRQQIWDWEQAGRLTAAERHYLLAALLYAVCYVSNTSGVFKGFHRGWGGATGTALYRILSHVRLVEPITHDNGADNPVTAADAQILAECLPDLARDCDIVYLDPPYNQHPYGSNYHVLNTVALWDDPPATTGIEGFGGKSAIRLDWRTARRSAYNARANATQALEQLLETVKARHILISYSTDGLIPLESLMGAACRRGATAALTSRYKRYRVSTQRYSSRGHNVEFVLTVDTDARPNPAAAAALVEQIRGAADESR
ncbi:MAG TPA: DNA adenine methylase, partial [Chloroflexota bacterium]|nr:DNA adenine methylase [Chloroflexota bacterium]